MREEMHQVIHRMQKKEHPENVQEDIHMDQVNDESEPHQDAPAEPLDHLRPAENEDASHEDEQTHALSCAES